MSEDELEVHDEVDWKVDADGTDYFVADGRRYDLAADGYAYDVGPAADETELTRELAPVRSYGTEGGPHRPADAGSVLTAPVVIGGRPGHAAEPDPRRGSGEQALLQVRGLRSGYGPLPVLHGVDLDIDVGQTAVLFGLNGAGKTTTAMNVSGALEVWQGTVTFDGVDLTRAGIKRCVDHGIVMVPEGRRVFPALTVAKNLQVGAWSQRKDHAWVAEQLDVVLGYFPRLRERLQQDAGTLSGGEQQMLAMARGLMARPRLLIIDEASMGLAPVVVSQVFEIVRQINADGVTVLMIEQNVGALDVADRGIVMAQGRVVTELTGAQLEDRTVVSELLMG